MRTGKSKEMRKIIKKKPRKKRIIIKRSKIRKRKREKNTESK
jgi:hypothetical protein